MPVKFQNISDIEVFKEGTHNGDKFTAQDIDDFVVNFNLLKNELIPKVKITHRADQKAIAGLASYGDVNNLFAKTIGGVKRLFVDLVDVPDQVVEWIRDKRFSERSIEIFRNITISGKKFKNVMVKVALLGHEIPAVSGMKPIELSIEIDSGVNVSSDFTLTGDEHAIHFTYEPEEKDIICKFTKSEKKGKHGMAEFCPVDGILVFGDSLSAFLNRRISAMETESKSRQDIISAMGVAAGISASTVNQILSGSINCPPIDRLRGMASALNTTLNDIISAAKRDGCNYENFEKGEKGHMSVEALKLKYEEMERDLGVLKGKMTDEASKAEYAALAGKVLSFKKVIDALEKSSGDDMSKITTELEANKKELNTYKQKDVENKETLRKQDIDTFVSEMKEKGSVIPAFESDLKTLLYSLDNSEKTLDYKIKTQKDGDVDTKISTLEYAMKLFSKIGKIVEYSEIAPSKDPNMSDKNKKVSEDDKQVTIGTETFAVDGVEDDIEIKEYARKNECSYEDAAYAVLDAKEKEKQS